MKFNIGETVKIKCYHPDWNGKQAEIKSIDGYYINVRPLGYSHIIELLQHEIEKENCNELCNR